MIEIDGSEAGGQILRSAISLSALTEKPFKIINIRGKREKGGLKHQHLAAVDAVAKICNAEVKGNSLGSTRLEFKPNGIQAGRYRFTISTAGSALLVLQTLIPILLKAKEKSIIRIGGGTDNPQAPGSFYFKNVFCDFLKKLGIEFEFNILRHGFYPKGGGLVELKINSLNELNEINFVERGNLEKVEISAIATNDLLNKNVAQRMIDGFKLNFDSNIDVNAKTYYVSSLSTGCFIHGSVNYSNFKVGDDVLGEIKKISEDLG